MTESHDRAIGRIEGKLDRLITETERAAQTRAKFFDRVDSIERKQDLTEKAIEDFSRRLEKVEKPIAEFTRLRERAIGALMLVSLSSAFIGGSIASYWGKIASFFKGL